MRIALAALAALLVLVLCAGSPAFADRAEQRDKRERAVAELPVIATLEGGRTTVRIRGELRRSHQRRAVQMAREVYDDFNARFARPRAKGERLPPPVDLCLFQTRRAYWAFLERAYGGRDHANYGFYMPGDRLVVINWARSKNNIRHELMHPLIGDDFRRAPAWLNEGLSALYTTTHFRRGQPQFRDNYRLGQLRRALRRDRVPTWRQLARSGRRQVYGRRQQTYYSTARYVLFYLARRGELVRFYRAMRARPQTAQRQQQLLERFVDRDDFIRWVKRRRR